MKRDFIKFFVLPAVVLGVAAFLFFTFADPTESAIDCCYHECRVGDPDKCQSGRVMRCTPPGGCDNDAYNDWCEVENCAAAGAACVGGSCVGGTGSSLTCSDGSLFNTCSNTQGAPWYCSGSGQLVENCGACGCAGSWVCGSSGTFCCDNRCNGVCSDAGCTTGQDPDCGCADGDGCCGPGCNIGNDSDCAANCATDGCNGICPPNCTAVTDGDCGCYSGNNCCAPGCDSSNDSDCAAPPPTPPGPTPPADQCLDTTPLNTCSSIMGRPWYCDASGNLVQDCGTCGCSGSRVCVGNVCCDNSCNGVCSNTACTVADDPDCGCQDNSGCCGMGCTVAQDNDCNTVCNADGCNGSCPSGCTVAEDPDCGCAGGNGCCPQACDNSTDGDCLGQFAVSITNPADGSSFPADATVNFQAVANGGLAPYFYSWVSNIDGVIGTGQTLTIN